LSPIILDHALASAGTDFEDNIQLASAESILVSHLITRNTKDFSSSRITVLNPDGWLAFKRSCPH
jgi:hypothetical protein